MTQHPPKKTRLYKGAKKKSAIPSARKPDITMRPSGKLGLILDRLEAKTGATLDELVDATGWQKHSVRGALSRLRTRGFTVWLDAKADRKTYRLAHVER